jgi:hypothetical protein
MLETKGRAVIVKNFTVNLDKSSACKACARTDNLKRIYIQQGSFTNELCYCQSCWNQIFNEIIKEDN